MGIADGAVNVLSTDEPKVDVDDGTTTLEFSTGEANPIHCVIYKEALDPGSVVTHMANQIAGDRMHVLDARLEDVGFLREAALAKFVMPYELQTVEGQQRGVLTILLHAHPVRSALCLQDAVEDERVFVRAATELFSSPDKRTEDPEPKFVAVFRIVHNQKFVGFERFKVADLANGHKLVTSVRSYLLPRSGDTFHAQDIASVLNVDQDGSVETGFWVRVVDEATMMEIKLERRQGLNYSYAGTLRGKSLQGEFTASHPSGLKTGDLPGRELRERLATAQPFEYTQEEYIPAADPRRPIAMRYSRASGEAGRSARMSTDGMEAALRLDASGTPLRVTARDADGGVQVVERLYVRGTIR